MTHVSTTLNDQMMAPMMETRRNIGKFQSTIGSTYGDEDQVYLISDGEDDDDSSDTDGSDESWNDLEMDIDDVMVSATGGRNRHSVTPEHLAQIWQISFDDAKRTLDTTSQHAVRTSNPTLSRNMELMIGC